MCLQMGTFQEGAAGMDKQASWTHKARTLQGEEGQAEGCTQGLLD